MKNGKTVLIVLVAFTIGYVVRMFIVPANNDVKAFYKPIDQVIAQRLVSNYVGEEKFVILDTALAALLRDATTSSPKHNSIVVYYASSKAGSAISDQTVVATVNGDQVVGSYYTMARGATRSTCPKMCDYLKGGLTIHKQPITPPAPEPVDSILPDNEEQPR